MSEYIPTFSFAEIEASDTASELAAAKENATRPAVAQITHFSTGTGQFRVKAPVLFPVVFHRSPHLATGSAVVNNPDLANWNDPVGNSGVYGWQVDDRGDYTGAYIWVRVEAFPVDPANQDDPPDMVVEHFLTFTGLAIKDLTNYFGSPNSSFLTTRTPGI